MCLCPHVRLETNPLSLRVCLCLWKECVLTPSLIRSHELRLFALKKKKKHFFLKMRVYIQYLHQVTF